MYVNHLGMEPKSEDIKSNCCNAPMNADISDEGTGCWMCSACSKPTDPKFILSWEEEFDLKYNHDNPDGRALMLFEDDTQRPAQYEIKTFIQKTIDQERSTLLDELLEAGPKDTPFESKLCQNRNGLDYCGTCEQVWEVCSCPARNTGFNQANTEWRNTIKKLRI
jgi:hypothetical protein